MIAAARLAAAAAALSAPAAPAETPPSTAPSIAIVEFVRGAPFIGLPKRCPGAPTDEEESADQLCFAGLYGGPVRTVRHLSGPRLPQGSVVRLTAHARTWPRGLRMLVAAQPFTDGDEQGHFAFFWALAEEDGAFCRAAADLPEGRVGETFRAGKLRRFKARGYAEAAEFRCIRP